MAAQPKSEAANTAFSKLSYLALARSRVFGLLAIAFFDPNADLVDQVLSGSYFSELHAYFHDLSIRQPDAMQALDALKSYQAGLTGTEPDELLKTLKVEYARLFIGPGPMLVPPYETFYGQKTKDSAPMIMVSPEAMAVENAYRESGLAISNDLREPPDHFATEAEFLYYACKKESDAWAAGENSVAKKWRRRELAFIDGHLGQWGRQFCQDVEKQTWHLFYAAIAHFAETFIMLEGSDAFENSPETEPLNGTAAA